MLVLVARPIVLCRRCILGCRKVATTFVCHIQLALATAACAGAAFDRRCAAVVIPAVFLLVVMSAIRLLSNMFFVSATRVTMVPVFKVMILVLGSRIVSPALLVMRHSLWCTVVGVLGLCFRLRAFLVGGHKLSRVVTCCPCQLSGVPGLSKALDDLAAANNGRVQDGGQ
jgi:hypothetical protein